ncbi:hypothetical protein PM082_021452 [Marasmius tenuissimus]|nr:hypothetical protein PM082_021452 [Marasmius tenuissimus]
MNFRTTFSRSPPSTPSKYADLGPGLLFGTPTKSPSSSPSKGPLVQSSTANSNYGMGYLAFPAGLATNSTSNSTTNKITEPKTEPSITSPVPQPQISPERAARINKEESEARRGEEEWVRTGGILRDANGNRDFKRTEELREELRLREVERGLLERWNSYETRWKELLRRVNVHDDDGEVTFEDIPWPVSVEEDKGKAKKRKGKERERRITLEDLTAENVEEFVLGSLRVRDSKVTRKERIRASLLRWHPDKLTSLLARVPEEHRETVEDGVGIVVRVLHDLNAK